MSLPAGATAVYNSSGSLQYYRHADWLGSVRLVSTPGRTVSGDTAYAPFGYAYAQSGSPALSFTGQNQDTAANLYGFMYREYGIQGRWPSPDPLDAGAFNLADPQSLDLYAYVRNSPMMLTDPLGLKCIYNSQGLAIGDDGTPPPCGGNQSVQVTAEPDCFMPVMGGTGSIEQVPCQLVFMGGRDTYYGGFEGSMSNGWAGPGIPGWGGGGGGTGGNTAGAPQALGSKLSYQQCMSNWNNTAAGKAVSFFSFLNMFKQPFEWFGLGGAKMVGIHALDKAEQSAAYTDYSITAGTTTEPAVLGGSEILGQAGIYGLAADTAVDAAGRFGCYEQDPNMFSLASPILPIFP